MKGIRCIGLLFSFCWCSAQQADSLRALLKQGKGDTNEARVCIELGKTILYTQMDSAYGLFQRGLSLSRKLNWKRGEALSLFESGRVFELRNQHPAAKKCYLDALVLMEALNDKRSIATLCHGIGFMYLNEAMYPKALEYNFRALKLFEELGDTANLGTMNGNIGAVYIEQGEYAKARTYFEKALALSQRAGNKEDMGNQYGSMGTSYYYEGNLEKGLEYYLKAYDLFREIRQEARAGIVLINIGALHGDMAKKAMERGDKKQGDELCAKARHYYEQALSINKRLDQKYSIVICEGNLGSLFLQTGQYKMAEEYLLHSLGLAKELSSPDDIRVAHENLSKLYEATGRHALALTHYKSFIATRDSIFNEENTKKSVRAEMNYEFEKKEAAARLEQEKKEAIALAERQRQRLVLYAVSGFGLLVLGFALFAYRSFLQKKKANDEISRQKHLIEEKQREILDSIHYARRIQQSLMPTEKMLERSLARLRR
jgi:tetratricopeptide (TPR) repeat protein